MEAVGLDLGIRNNDGGGRLIGRTQEIDDV